jgi:hypothetical protein
MTKIGDLEKRVTKLEKELSTLTKTHSEPQATAMDLARPSGKTHKHSKKHTPGKTKKKRKMNEYFKMMLAAKKAGKPSFVYKGHTYKGTKHPRLGMVYKRG